MIDWLRLLAESSIRVSILAGIMAIALAAIRVRAGATRHAVWTAVAGCMLFTPLILYSVPPVPAPLPPALSPLSFDAPIPMPRLVEPPTRPALPEIKPAAGEMHALPWPAVVLAIYGLGVLAVFARFLSGWFAVRRIGCGINLVPALSCRWPVSESAAVSVPVTIGILRPRIILPSTWGTWPGDDMLQAALAHEGAHIVRRDPLTGLVARLNCCIFWFHPLAWWLNKAIAAAAEDACDAAGVQAASDSRRYAAILLQFAEMAAQSGGRLTRRALGIDGTGSLGSRIDRVLRGDGLRASSRTQKATLLIVCAASIFVAECRQQNVAPLAANPMRVEAETNMKAIRELLRSIDEMTAQQALDLEDAVDRTPEDLELLRKLLTFYQRRGVKVLGMEHSIAARRQRILWLIAHHPESPLAGSFAARLLPGPDELPDAAGYAQARKLWLAKVSPSSGVDWRVLENAAFLFTITDPELAEKLLLRGQAVNPGRNWTGELAQVYISTILGNNASQPMGYVRSVDLRKAHSPFAQEVRRKLEASHDSRLLLLIGERLVMGNRLLYRQKSIDFDPVALGKSYVERALQLDPNSPGAQRVMRQILTPRPQIPVDLWHLTPEEQLNAVARLPESQRFVLLPQMAVNSYRAGESADYYRHDPAQAKADWSRGMKEAHAVLELASKFRGDPEYGTAIYLANLTLGLIAMRGGDQKAAVKYMLAASVAPPSNRLAIGDGIDFVMKLTGTLLKYGERGSVVTFLERAAQLNVVQKPLLLRGATDIRHGVAPPWYPNS